MLSEEDIQKNKEEDISSEMNNKEFNRHVRKFNEVLEYEINNKINNKKEEGEKASSASLNLRSGGHPMFNSLLTEMAELHARKDGDYAGSKPLSNFDASESFGIPAYKGVLIRMSDKWSRITTLLKNENLMDYQANDPLVKDETIEDTLMDLAVYSLITIILRKEFKEFVYGEA